LADNEKLWLLLKTVVEGGAGWIYVKKYSGKKDGRGAFFALYAHGMTASNAGVLKTKAHAKLVTLQFDGPKRNWSLRSFCTAVMEQYTVIDRYAPEGSLIDES